MDQYGLLSFIVPLRNVSYSDGILLGTRILNGLN